MMKLLKTMSASVLVATCFVKTSLATNGMLMEGYGPISHALGGASIAYDNGNSAMANNPATLSLSKSNSRVDLALGVLMPKVKYKTAGPDFKSKSESFFMPAAGYVKKNNKLSYGIGVYSQGGMGTDYLNNMPMYSQVIFAKVITPISYEVNEKLSIGATLEYVRANMDLVMGPFNFKDHSDFSGAAKGDGVSGSIGAVYKLTDKLNFGAIYKLEGNISDLKGKKAKVKNLDLPAIVGFGASYWVTEKTMLTADYKRIFWSDSMKTIIVTQNGATMSMPQNWKDQNVLSLGISHNFNNELTLRAGANFANNPVKHNLTPLFPATIRNHYTLGFGYKFDCKNSIDSSFAYAPKVEENNGMGFGGKTYHSQQSMQIMYSYQF